MSVRFDRVRDGLVIVIEGDFDMRTAHKPYEALAARLDEAEPPHHIVVDLTAMTFIDSTGLGGLIRIKDEAMSRGIPLSLRGVDPRIRPLFAMTGLDQEFRIEPDQTSAR